MFVLLQCHMWDHMDHVINKNERWNSSFALAQLSFSFSKVFDHDLKIQINLDSVSSQFLYHCFFFAIYDRKYCLKPNLFSN